MKRKTMSAAWLSHMRPAQLTAAQLCLWNQLVCAVCMHELLQQVKFIIIIYSHHYGTFEV